MLLSYNFAYIFIMASLGVFVKDIFFKNLSDTQYSDAVLIKDIKKTSPVVQKNVEHFLTTLAIIDTYFFILGSNYSVIGTLFYIPLGVVLMFYLNSIISTHGLNYVESIEEYRSKSEISTNNPMFVMFCNPSFMTRFRKLLFLHTFLFGINEYVIFYILMVPFLINVAKPFNIRPDNITTFVNVENITQVLSVVQKYYYKNEKSILHLYVKVLRYSKPVQRLYNKYFKTKTIPLGGEETYDTISELQTMTPEELVPRDTINDPHNNGVPITKSNLDVQPTPETSPEAEAIQDTATEPEPESEPEPETERNQNTSESEETY